MEVTKRAVAIYARFFGQLDICSSHGLDHALKVLSNCRHAITAYFNQFPEGKKSTE